MPNIKSACKRVKVSEKKTLANKMKKSELRTTLKNAKASVAANDNAAEAYKKAQKALDKAAQKGHISKNAASRTKSRMAKAVNAAQ